MMDLYARGWSGMGTGQKTDIPMRADAYAGEDL